MQAEAAGQAPWVCSCTGHSLPCECWALDRARPNSCTPTGHCRPDPRHPQQALEKRCPRKAWPYQMTLWEMKIRGWKQAARGGSCPPLGSRKMAAPPTTSYCSPRPPTGPSDAETEPLTERGARKLATYKAQHNYTQVCAEQEHA